MNTSAHGTPIAEKMASSNYIPLEHFTEIIRRCIGQCTINSHDALFQFINVIQYNARRI